MCLRWGRQRGRGDGLVIRRGRGRRRRTQGQTARVLALAGVATVAARARRATIELPVPTPCHIRCTDDRDGDRNGSDPSSRRLRLWPVGLSRRLAGPSLEDSEPPAESAPKSLNGSSCRALPQPSGPSRARPGPPGGRARPEHPPLTGTGTGTGGTSESVSVTHGGPGRPVHRN